MAWWRGSQGLYCGSPRPSAACSSRISPWLGDSQTRPGSDTGRAAVSHNTERAVLALIILSRRRKLATTHSDVRAVRS